MPDFNSKTFLQGSACMSFIKRLPSPLGGRTNANIGPYVTKQSLKLTHHYSATGRELAELNVGLWSSNGKERETKAKNSPARQQSLQRKALRKAMSLSLPCPFARGQGNKQGRGRGRGRSLPAHRRDFIQTLRTERQGRWPPGDKKLPKCLPNPASDWRVPNLPRQKGKTTHFSPLSAAIMRGRGGEGRGGQVLS